MEMAQRQLALKLWLAATGKCVDRVDTPPRELTMADMCLQNARVLADRSGGEAAQLSDFGRAPAQAAGQLGTNPGERAPAGPGSKMARVAEIAQSVEQIQKFETFCVRSSELNSYDPSLECVAAVTRCRGTFCDLRGGPRFPPTGGAYFPCGRTLQQYLPHLQKARFLLGCDLSWRTEAVAQAARGRAGAGNWAHAPKLAVTGGLFGEILRHISLSDEFTRALWFSWTFLVRVQSECLPLASQPPTEKMDADSALRPLAVIGIWKR